MECKNEECRTVLFGDFENKQGLCTDCYIEKLEAENKRLRENLDEKCKIIATRDYELSSYKSWSLKIQDWLNNLCDVLGIEKIDILEINNQ